jgi:hypothetical protein
MFQKLLVLITIVTALSGCASGPPLSELRKEIKTTTFVQHGREPADLRFGVVDTASWWATNGANVAMNTGGLAWYAVGSAAQSVKDGQMPSDVKIMTYLYDGYPMADQAVAGIMPELARAWRVPYDHKNFQLVEKGTPLEDKDGYLTALKPTTDLVLVAWLARVSLTEKITMGAAFKAGFSLGTSTKDVTAETVIGLRAYRREPATGRYKNVWSQPCVMTNMEMEKSYPFPELVTSREKAKTLWEEATPKIITQCKKALEYFGKDA